MTHFPNRISAWCKRASRRIGRFLTALTALTFIGAVIVLVWTPLLLAAAVALLYFTVLWFLPTQTVLTLLLWGFGVLATLAGLAFGLSRSLSESDPTRSSATFAGTKLFHAALLVIVTTLPVYAELNVVNDVLSLVPRELPLILERFQLPLGWLDLTGFINWLASDGFHRFFNLMLLYLSLFAFISIVQALWALSRLLHFREYALFGQQWPDWQGLGKALLFRDKRGSIPPKSSLGP